MFWQQQSLNLAAWFPQLRHQYLHLQLSSAAMFNVCWNKQPVTPSQTQIYSTINYKCSSDMCRLYQSHSSFCKGEQEALAD